MPLARHKAPGVRGRLGYGSLADDQDAGLDTRVAGEPTSRPPFAPAPGSRSPLGSLPQHHLGMSNNSAWCPTTRSPRPDSPPSPAASAASTPPPGLIVRRVRRLNPATIAARQTEAFTVFRDYAVFPDSRESTPLAPHAGPARPAVDRGRRAERMQALASDVLDELGDGRVVGDRGDGSRCLQQTWRGSDAGDPLHPCRRGHPGAVLSIPGTSGVPPQGQMPPTAFLGRMWAFSHEPAGDLTRSASACPAPDRA